MNDAATIPAGDAVAPVISLMRDVLAAQRAAFLADSAPTAEVRIDRIDRTIALLLENQARI